MNTENESVSAAAANHSGKSVAPAKKLATGTKPKAASAAKTTKARQGPPRSSRAARSAKKLVCRYCGSDDLAPSFRKRRDARCRACFKRRYGSAARDNKTARTRKVKAGS